MGEFWSRRFAQPLAEFPPARARNKAGQLPLTGADWPVRTSWPSFCLRWWCEDQIINASAACALLDLEMAVETRRPFALCSSSFAR